jgi:transcriptional regulator with XRE-family HTH domain
MSRRPTARSAIHARQHVLDKHVGTRIRMRRMMLAKTQQQVGAVLGVSLQQVQKYEKGYNRISASALFYVAQYLNIPLTFFFEEAE